MQAAIAGGSDIYVLSHRCCLCEGELKQPQTKEAETLQPTLKVCTFVQGE